MNAEEDHSLTNDDEGGFVAAAAAAESTRSLHPPTKPIQHQSFSFSSDDEALGSTKETDGSDDRIEAVHHEVQTLLVERSHLRRRVEEMTAQMEHSDAGARSIAARAADLEGELARTQEDLTLTSSEAEEARAEAESLRRVIKDLEVRMADLAMKEGEVRSLKEDLESEKEKSRVAAAEKEEELRVVREKERLEVEEKEGVILSLKEELRLARDKEREVLEIELKKLSLNTKQMKDQNSAENDDADVFQNSSGMELTEGDGMRVSWVTAAAVAASTGVIAASITAFCLRHSRDRWHLTVGRISFLSNVLHIHIEKRRLLQLPLLLLPPLLILLLPQLHPRSSTRSPSHSILPLPPSILPTIILPLPPSTPQPPYPQPPYSQSSYSRPPYSQTPPLPAEAPTQDARVH